MSDERDFDYNEYGIWSGKPLLPKYNRKERREYIKQHKNNKLANYCPFCNAKTLKITDDNCDVCCELCGKKVEED